jgi:hypothetical protein
MTGSQGRHISGDSWQHNVKSGIKKSSQELVNEQSGGHIPAKKGF